LWEYFGDGSELLDSGWFQVDEGALKRDELTIVVQVNGKLRSRITVSADCTDKELESAALADEVIQRHIDNRDVSRIIVVPGKLVNIVVKP
jgi:leucyl-tRNA synthetase